MYKSTDNGISRRGFLVGGSSLLALIAYGCLRNLPTTPQLNPEELTSKVSYWDYKSSQSPTPEPIKYPTNPELGGAELTVRFKGKYPWQEWHFIDGVTSSYFEANRGKRVRNDNLPKYNNVPDYVRVYTVGVDRLHREVEGETIAELRGEGRISDEYNDLYRGIRDSFVGSNTNRFRKLVSGRIDELREDKTDFTTTLKVKGENANFSISYGVIDVSNLEYAVVLPTTVRVWRRDIKDALDNPNLHLPDYTAEASPRRYGAKREMDSPISYIGTESFKSGGGHPIRIYRDMSPWTQALIGDLVLVAVHAAGRSMDDIIEEIKQQEERKNFWLEQRRKN